MLPGNQSLNGKRAVLRRTMDRVRARFSVVGADVGSNAEHARTMVGQEGPVFVEADVREPVLELRKGVVRWSPVAHEIDEGVL